MSININFWELFMSTIPSFADAVGTAQDYIVGTAITDVRVPVAAGDPTPTYAVVGTLPAGIVFTVANYLISGTPTEVGSGTITIRATNSEGSADWTMDYAITAAAVVVVEVISFEERLATSVQSFVAAWRGKKASAAGVSDAEGSLDVAKRGVVTAEGSLATAKVTESDSATALDLMADSVIALMKEVKVINSA